MQKIIRKIINIVKIIGFIILPYILESIYIKLMIVFSTYLPSNIRQIIISISNTAAIFIFYYLAHGVMIHEMGHYFTANKYSKTTADIDLISYPYRKKINLGNISLGRKKGLDGCGNTHLSNLFQPYTAEEIVDIAKAGYKWQHIGSIISLIIHIPIMYNVYTHNGFNTTESKNIVIMIAILYIISYLMECRAIKRGRLRVKWNDWEIWHDPEGFKKYYLNEYGKKKDIEQ